MDRSRAAYCECGPCADFDAANGVYVLPTFKDYDDINPNAPGEISDRHYLLCMSHMYGFVLKDRVYGEFNSRLIEVIQRSESKL